MLSQKFWEQLIRIVVLLEKKALSIKKHAKTYLMLNRVIHFATILSSSLIALNDFISCN